MKEKYKIFQNKKLETMVVEIDITKTEDTFRELLQLIQEIEEEKLLKEKLEVNDIYFKQEVE